LLRFVTTQHTKTPLSAPDNFPNSEHRPAHSAVDYREYTDQKLCRKFTFAGWFAAFSVVAIAAGLVYRHRDQKKKEALPPEFQVRGQSKWHSTNNAIKTLAGIHH